jgi:hypothetical protein
MESISEKTGWDGLGHSSLTSATAGRNNLTSSLFSDFTSLNSSHGGAGSYYWIIPENASTTTLQALPQPRVRDLGLARAEIGVLGLVLALTTLGNGFVLWVLLRRRKQNAPMHLFMVNLCLADLVVALFQVRLTPQGMESTTVFLRLILTLFCLLGTTLVYSTSVAYE